MIVVNTGSRTCSGFLIDPQYAITAANCVYNVNYASITVYLGATQISDTTDRVTRYVANVTIPSGYSSSSSNYDIAVLKLSTSVILSSTIAQCCLSYDTTLPTVGTNAVIAGWGQTSLISGISDSLRQAVVQVDSPSTCGISSTNASLFCAGYGSVETCPGDNGGPLMINTNNTWTCAGVIIGGSSSCYNTAGYTRVSSYIDLIYTAFLY
jgi:secreted trypsin-like serine protease